MKSCCFTGHRIIKSEDILVERLVDEITKLVKNGVIHFYAGGAIGWDTLCEKTVLNLRKEYPKIRLHLILPCPPEQQSLKWNTVQKQEFKKIIDSSDSVEVLSPNYYDGCMKKRNARLVDLADVCICYYNGKKTSGTAQTVRMAKEKNIEVINLCY